MRKRALVGVIVLGIGIGIAWFSQARGVGKDRPAQAGEFTKAALRDLEVFVKATGVVKPKAGAEVRVGTPLTGVVRRLRVRTGDRVEQGQLLFELDARTLDARRDQSAAALASAEANLRYVKADWERQKELATSGAISTSAVDNAERIYAVASAAVEEARAQLALARIQLADTRVTAPITGVVATMSVQQGETIGAPGTPAFVTLVDPERLEIWTYVDETDIGRIATHQRVRFTVDTYPDHEFEGKVTAIYPKPEIRDNVVNYIVCVDFSQSSDHVVRPEMTTNVRIFTAQRGKVLTVARRAVRRDRGQAYVQVRSGADTTRKTITTGIHDDNYVEVKAGLSPGAEVLVGTSTSVESPKEPPK